MTSINYQSLFMHLKVQYTCMVPCVVETPVWAVLMLFARGFWQTWSPHHSPSRHKEQAVAIVMGEMHVCRTRGEMGREESGISSHH